MQPGLAGDTPVFIGSYRYGDVNEQVSNEFFVSCNWENEIVVASYRDGAIVFSTKFPGDVIACCFVESLYNIAVLFRDKLEVYNIEKMFRHNVSEFEMMNGKIAEIELKVRKFEYIKYDLDSSIILIMGKTLDMIKVDLTDHTHLTPLSIPKYLRTQVEDVGYVKLLRTEICISCFISLLSVPVLFVLCYCVSEEGYVFCGHSLIRVSGVVKALVVNSFKQEDTQLIDVYILSDSDRLTMYRFNEWLISRSLKSNICSPDYFWPDIITPLYSAPLASILYETIDTSLKPKSSTLLPLNFLNQNQSGKSTEYFYIYRKFDSTPGIFIASLGLSALVIYDLSINPQYNDEEYIIPVYGKEMMKIRIMASIRTVEDDNFDTRQSGYHPEQHKDKRYPILTTNSTILVNNIVSSSMNITQNLLFNNYKLIIVQRINGIAHSVISFILHNNYLQNYGISSDSTLLFVSKNVKFVFDSVSMRYYYVDTLGNIYCSRYDSRINRRSLFNVCWCANISKIVNMENVSCDISTSHHKYIMVSVHYREKNKVSFIAMERESKAIYMLKEDVRIPKNPIDIFGYYESYEAMEHKKETIDHNGENKIYIPRLGALVEFQEDEPGILVTLNSIGKGKKISGMNLHLSFSGILPQGLKLCQYINCFNINNCYSDNHCRTILLLVLGKKNKEGTLTNSVVSYLLRVDLLKLLIHQIPTILNEMKELDPSGKTFKDIGPIEVKILPSAVRLLKLLRVDPKSDFVYHCGRLYYINAAHDVVYRDGEVFLRCEKANSLRVSDGELLITTEDKVVLVSGEEENGGSRGKKKGIIHVKNIQALLTHYTDYLEDVKKSVQTIIEKAKADTTDIGHFEVIDDIIPQIAPIVPFLLNYYQKNVDVWKW